MVTYQLKSPPAVSQSLLCWFRYKNKQKNTTPKQTGSTPFPSGCYGCGKAWKNFRAAQDTPRGPPGEKGQARGAEGPPGQSWQGVRGHSQGCFKAASPHAGTWQARGLPCPARPLPVQCSSILFPSDAFTLRARAGTSKVPGGEGDGAGQCVLDVTPWTLAHRARPSLQDGGGQFRAPCYHGNGHNRLVGPQAVCDGLETCSTPGKTTIRRQQ